MAHSLAPTGRPRSLTAFALLTAALLLAGCMANGLPPGDAGTAGPVTGAVAGVKAAEPWLIPSPEPGLMMHATLFRPPGAGPFPLAIINHGSEQDLFRRARMPAPSFPALTEWFLARGYAVVLPLRPGHGATGGRYLEDQGSCGNADFAKAGSGAADSIAATVEFMRRQPFVRPNGIVVAGHSAGGWGALAYAARNPSGIRAVISFAGGRGGHQFDRPNDNCAPERLIGAAGVFGKTARLPTLWLYAANDTYFGPSLSRAMEDAFSQAGGQAEYDLFPALPGEGHFLVQSALWSGKLDDFLKRHP